MEDAIRVRLDDQARRLSEIEQTQPAVMASQIAALREDMAELRDEVKSLKRAQYAVALSVTSGAVIWAFTAFQIWGGP